jgi:hypothetical protein
MGKMYGLVKHLFGIQVKERVTEMMIFGNSLEDEPPEIAPIVTTRKT